MSAHHAAAPALVPPISIGVRRGPDGIVLDGSAGEGGGQILRTALTLSLATGTPFVLENVRAGRKKPGLMRQHLACVKAALAISEADVDGAELGSTKLGFRPGPVVARDHAVDIGSAGSVALVLQTIALPLALAAKSPIRVVVRGGTHALWAPPYPFLEEAWLPLVVRAGANIGLELVANGFHPAGGGEVVMTVGPTSALAALHLDPQSGVHPPPAIRAIVAGLSESIARRELGAAAAALAGIPSTSSSARVPSPGPGNAMWLTCRDEGTGITNVFSGIGDIGVLAETLASEVARAFLGWKASGAAVEGHLADQVMLPIALAGDGSFTTNELSLHAQTNIEVIHAFTGLRLAVWRLGDTLYRVAVSERK